MARRFDPNMINPRERALDRSWRLRDACEILKAARRAPLSPRDVRSIRAILKEGDGLILEDDGHPDTATYVGFCQRLGTALEVAFAEGATPMTQEIRAALLALREQEEAKLPPSVLVPASGGFSF